MPPDSELVDLIEQAYLEGQIKFGMPLRCDRALLGGSLCLCATQFLAFGVAQIGGNIALPICLRGDKCFGVVAVALVSRHAVGTGVAPHLKHFSGAIDRKIMVGRVFAEGIAHHRLR